MNNNNQLEFLKIIARINSAAKSNSDKIKVTFEYYDLAGCMTRDMDPLNPTLKESLRRAFKTRRAWSAMKEADLDGVLSCWELARTRVDFAYMDRITNGGWIEGDRWRTGSVTRDLDGNETTHETNSQQIELWQLDRILEEIDPGISFLRYKNLMRKMNIELQSGTESDYYTTSNYAFYTVKIGNVIEALDEAGITWG